jgi:5S rRNA maturation endonuclease (ribonuclease M5)
MFYMLTGQIVSRDMPELGIEDHNPHDLLWDRSGVSAYESDERRSKKRYGVIMEEARIIPVTDDAEAYRYCLSRGIDEHLIADWNMSYARRARIRNVDAPAPGTLVSQRLLIPIYEHDEVWSIECRDITRKDGKKVIYPRGCSVNTLFELDKLDRHKTLVVVEGLMDLVKVRRVYANSTCTFGIGISRRQAELLNEFDKIILLPDSDEGGDTFITTVADLLENELWVCRVPEKDPGESNDDHIRAAIDGAKMAIELLIDKVDLFPSEKLLW